jgi:hypothetical protein
MAVIVLDNFARIAAAEDLASDATPAPTNTPGNNWTTNSANQVVGATGGGFVNITGSTDWALLDVETAEQEVSAVITGTGTAEGAIAARATDASNTYLAAVRFDVGRVRLYRRVSGANTQLLSVNSAMSSGDTLSIKVTGSGATVTIEVKVNGSHIAGSPFSDTDGARLTSGNLAGLFALFSNTSTALFNADDFTVDDTLGGGGGGGLVIPVAMSSYRRRWAA